MKNILACIALYWFVACFTATAGAQNILYDLEDLPFDAQTALSDMQGGTTAAFSSLADPGGFKINQSFFFTLTGQVLLSPGGAGQDGIPLIIQFDHRLNSITLNFATSDFDPFTLEAFSGGPGGQSVGSISETGQIPTDYFVPEGSISFSSPSLTSFDTVQLTSSAQDFAVDNISISVIPKAVPEANTCVLLAAGFASLLCMGWRRVWRANRNTGNSRH